MPIQKQDVASPEKPLDDLETIPEWLNLTAQQRRAAWEKFDRDPPEWYRKLIADKGKKFCERLPIASRTRYIPLDGGEVAHSNLTQENVMSSTDTTTETTERKARKAPAKKVAAKKGKAPAKKAAAKKVAAKKAKGNGVSRVIVPKVEVALTAKGGEAIMDRVLGPRQSTKGAYLFAFLLNNRKKDLTWGAVQKAIYGKASAEFDAAMSIRLKDLREKIEAAKEKLSLVFSKKEDNIRLS